MIRIGASCVKSLKMVVPEAKVIETRRFLIYPTEWYEISKKCIAEKKYLILTVCIGRDKSIEYMPSESQWRSIIEDSTIKLLSLGANWNNCRVDIINEPMKWTDKSTYAYLVNMAHSQINGRLPVGAGCEEFVKAQACGDMYPHLLRYGHFETLVIHIQGSCQTEIDCSKWTNLALNWATSHKKKLDCNEANMFDVATSIGYEKLLMQLKYAEKIGCKNFPVVFLNLDQSAFSQDTDKWKFLSFKVNGKLRSPYWNDFVNIINRKAPDPNIEPIPIIISEEDDMFKLKVLQMGSRGNQVKILQEILMIEYGFPNDYANPFDGKFGKFTEDQVKEYQNKNNLKVDGWVGINTMTDLILGVDRKPVIDRKFSTDYWFRKLMIYMAYE